MPYRPVEHWGNSLWKYIHTICVIDNDVPDENARENRYALNCLKNLSECIPCYHCRNDWNNAILELDTLDLSKSMILFEWTWQLHNRINDKLKKPMISYEDAFQMYTKNI